MTEVPELQTPKEPLSVLVIEDDADLRTLLQLLLEQSGYRAVAAENGRDALQVVDQYGPPKLVLLDMRMPVMNGWEFARAFRERGHKTPILVLTAAAHATQFAKEIDADGCLSKPFSLNELVEAVNRYVGR